MRGQIRRYPLAVHANQAQAAERGTGRSTHAQAAGATSDRHRFWSERVAGAAHESWANLAAVLRKIRDSPRRGNSEVPPRKLTRVARGLHIVFTPHGRAT